MIRMGVHKLRWFLLSILPAMLWMAALPGCADPKFQEASQIRLDRIQGYRQRFIHREGESDARLAHTESVIQRLQQYHAKRLDVQGDYYQRRHQRELNRWPGRVQRQRQVIERGLRGKPEQIPKTYALMFY